MAIKLDSIQASLLHSLLENETHISAVRLGEQVGISPRTLRYRLPLLESWLTPYGAKLIVKPGKGISLIATPQIREQLRKELSEDLVEASLPNEDRMDYLFFLLLFEEGNATFAELQTELGVSRSTFIRDLKQCEERLLQKGLSLKRIRLIGWKIIGEEIAKRHLLVEQLYQHKITEIFAEWIAQQTDNNKTLTVLQSALLKKFHKSKLLEAHRLISGIDNRLKLNLTDEDILYLTTYSACVLYRIQRGHFVQVETDPYDENIADELPIIRSLINSIWTTNSHFIAKDEITQLLLEIRACQGSLTLETGAFLDGDNSFSRTVAERMISQIEKLQGCPIANEEIIEQMSIHLSRALSRLKAGLPLHNPLIDDVKKAYPHLWQKSYQVAREVHQEYGIFVPEAELAYLVMYLALAVQLAEQDSRQRFRAVVSCPTGGVMARLLVYRLQSSFPEIEVLESVSLRELHRYNPKNADLVITTVKRSHKTLPTVTVNPLLGEEDIAKIKETLRTIRYQKNENHIRGLEQWQ